MTGPRIMSDPLALSAGLNLLLGRRRVRSDQPASTSFDDRETLPATLNDTDNAAETPRPPATELRASRRTSP